MPLRNVSNVRYIFVTGGVTSSLGKGILSASLGKLLQARGYSVTIQKCDPYLNVDPGTMSPYEHGECFVTDDGTETDLDLGHYERFLGISTSAKNSVTTGRIYYNLITRERRGDFLGKTVQVIPHVTDEIKGHVYKLGDTHDYDIIITEIGGCVGDIESQPFIEAIRQVKLELAHEQTLFIHLTLVPYLTATRELKTKPTQQSVKELLSLGIQPDILVCRCSEKMPQALREKIALHCNVPINYVIEDLDSRSIYEVPLMMREEKLDQQVLTELALTEQRPPDLTVWERFIHNINTATKSVRIALVGKYVSTQDAYISVKEALIHAGASQQCKVEISWISADSLEEEAELKQLDGHHGVLLAPGFGARGLEGKVQAANYARVTSCPFLGICLGMQCAVLAFARSVLQISANSTEMDINTSIPMIDLMEKQKHSSQKGGTMRLGSYTCQISEPSKAYQAYNCTTIKERHRHRYEFNSAYADQLAEAGMHITGINPETGLAEIIELADHPWYVGCQFHPEYSSRVEKPHALFVHFIRAALANKHDSYTK